MCRQVPRKAILCAFGLLLGSLVSVSGCGSFLAFFLGELTGQALRDDDQTDRTPAAVASIRVVPERLEITTCDGVAEYKVLLRVGEADEVEISGGDGISHQSADPSIATVVDLGRIRAVANGTTAVNVSYPDPTDETGESLISTSIPVTVTVPPTSLLRIRTDPPQLTFGAPSDRTQLSVLAAYDCGPDQPISAAGGGIQFSSDDIHVATVDANGVVAPIARGRASIRAVANGKALDVPVDVTFCKPRIAHVHPAPPVTRESAIRLTGQAEPNSKIEVFGPAANVTTVVDGGGSFAVDVPLGANRGNMLFVTSIVEESACSGRSSSTTLTVTNDNQAPAVFIDFPVPGTNLITGTTDVAGRVSDLLSGYAGLKVVVNGVEAAVNRGIGTNGTFFARNVPLAAGQTNTLSATATDLVGNASSESITVSQVPIDPTAPVVRMVAGNAQSGPFMSPLSEPLAVRVEKRDGTPFANKLVTFHVTRSDVRLSAANDFSQTTPGALTAQVRTDGEGLARVFVELGSDAGMGNARIEATSVGAQGAVMFCASVLPGPAHQINIGTGNNQRAEAGGPAPEPLRIRVSDACNAISNRPIVYRVIRGGGKLLVPDTGEPVEMLTVFSSDTGHAEARFVLGPEVGNNLVDVNFEGNPTGPATFVVFGVARREAPATFAGLVLSNSNEPLGGAIVQLLVNGQMVGEATSSANGQFRIENIAGGGKADLLIDADPITTVNNQPIATNIRYPDMHYETLVVPNSENALPMNVLLPPLDRANDRQYRFDDSNPLELTCDGMDGITLIVRPHTRITLPDGTVIDANNPGPVTLALNQVHHDDVPMPMPDGVAPPFAWTFQPGGAHFDTPVAIEYPNMSGLPAGAISYFLSFNHDTNKFEIVASGRVSEDGSRSVTDRGVGITTSGWGCNCPPYSVTGEARSCPCVAAGFFEGGPESSGSDALAAVIENIGIQSRPCCVAIRRIPAGSLFQPSGQPQLEQFSAWLNQITSAECNPFVVLVGYSLGGDTVNLSHSITADYRISVDPVDRGWLYGFQPSGFTCGLAAVACGVNQGECFYSAGAADRNFVTPQLNNWADFGCGGASTSCFAIQDCYRGYRIGRDTTIDGTNHFDILRNTEVVDTIRSTIIDAIASCDPECLQSQQRDTTTRPSLFSADWTFSAAGQTITAERDGQFILPNVNAADVFGSAGPGSPPDSVADEPLRVIATAQVEGHTWFAFSEPLTLRTNSVLRVRDLSITDTPPRSVHRLRLQPDDGAGNILTALDQTLQMESIGDLTDGTLDEDLTPATKWTTYRTSNPAIALVNADGLVTAKGRGVTFITATNEGATSTARVIVAPGDPLTTVEGYVFFPDGRPASGAQITVFPVSLTGSTNAGGFFSLPGVPTTLGALQVSASIRVVNVDFTGRVENVQLTGGAISDVGVINLVEGGIGGPIILGGDDLTDHGGIDASGNLLNGWIYIRRAIEDLRPEVFRFGNDGSIAALGSSPSSATCCDAGAGIGRAAEAAGILVNYYDGAANIDRFFADMATGAANPGIVWIAGTGANNNLDDVEGSRLTAHAAEIAAFANSGGGLMAHGSGSAAYGWLTTLIPTISEVNGGSQDDLELTADGIESFPGLTNSHVNAGPWHSYFRGDFGGLKVLVQSNRILDDQGRRAAVIIGGKLVELP